MVASTTYPILNLIKESYPKQIELMATTIIVYTFKIHDICMHIHADVYTRTHTPTHDY